MFGEPEYPSYLNLKIDEIEDRIQEASQIFSPCRLCPHACKVDRKNGQLGICRSGRDIFISSYNVHFGEEPPISGKFGSGTIFFTHCNLKCVYCQNYPISQFGNGKKVTILKLAQIMLELQRKKCHNVNLVTPTHFIFQIMQSIKIAIELGLQIPIVYNSSGYDSVEVLKLLRGIVDIYLPDARYSDNVLGEKYSGAPHYFEIMKSALKEMHHQVGDLILDENGIALSGLIIRHLILPERQSGTKKIMKFIAKKISPHTHVSLMSQYFPAYRAKEYLSLSRKINDEENKEALVEFKNAGLENGWFQEN